MLLAIFVVVVDGEVEPDRFWDELCHCAGELNVNYTTYECIVIISANIKAVCI